MVALEAMANGTPLAVYPVGGVAEYVANSRGGVVVDQSPGALATACASLIDDAEAWGRISRAALFAAAGVHSIDTHCETLERVFAEAANG